MQLESVIYYKSSAKMKELGDDSVELIVTSPPYPMIAMWDEIFSSQSDDVKTAFERGDGKAAWEHMHRGLDSVWRECCRVLRPGGFACINIGDATRSVGEQFRLYPNHSRITAAFREQGVDCLPMIHWFKPTNAPNKFMGSGMLPSGAYVTLEHEYILIFRKGGKRVFSAAEQESRRRSAFFWEERNMWFSDVWDFRGVNQLLNPSSRKPSAGQQSSAKQLQLQGLPQPAARERSGAYPFELPHRLINMYSLQGDSVLDPFMGTGTTLAAAVVNGRRSIGYELDRGLEAEIQLKAGQAASQAAELNSLRLRRHQDFIEARAVEKGRPKYRNVNYGFDVITRQEREILLPELDSLQTDGSFIAEYSAEV